jgi:hypothetical protein
VQVRPVSRGCSFPPRPPVHPPYTYLTLHTPYIRPTYEAGELHPAHGQHIIQADICLRHNLWRALTAVAATAPPPRLHPRLGTTRRHRSWRACSNPASLVPRSANGWLPQVGIFTRAWCSSPLLLHPQRLIPRRLPLLRPSLAIARDQRVQGRRRHPRTHIRKPTPTPARTLTRNRMPVPTLSRAPAALIRNLINPW